MYKTSKNGLEFGEIKIEIEMERLRLPLLRVKIAENIKMAFYGAIFSTIDRHCFFGGNLHH